MKKFDIRDDVALAHAAATEFEKEIPGRMLVPRRPTEAHYMALLSHEPAACRRPELPAR
jgi:hypothetical protein